MVEDVFDSLEVAHVHKIELEHPEVEKTGGATVLLEKPPHMSHWVLSTFTGERAVVIDEQIFTFKLKLYLERRWCKWPTIGRQGPGDGRWQ